MKRKMLSIVLAGVMALGLLIGCGETEQTEKVI